MYRKLKDVSELICPACGKNEPVFFMKYELKGWPMGKVTRSSPFVQYYDMEIDYDFGNITREMDEAILYGDADCECANCGTAIQYYEEVEDETECSRSSE